MKRRFTASVWREDSWFVAQCLEEDVASQGATEQHAVDNLREALSLHLRPPSAPLPLEPMCLEITVDAT